MLSMEAGKHWHSGEVNALLPDLCFWSGRQFPLRLRHHHRLDTLSADS